MALLHVYRNRRRVQGLACRLLLQQLFSLIGRRVHFL